MRITVRGEGRRLFIPIPTWILANPLTAGLASCASRRSEVPLNARQLRRLFRALRKSRAVLNGLPFVEVTDADGTYVKITL